MVEGIVLGIIQGITEWLPISSEAVVILVKVNFFGNGESLKELIGFALFLHLGTFLAAAWYLRDDVVALIKMLFKPSRIFADGETERILRFLILATFISGIIGFFLLEVFLPSVEGQVASSTKVITGGVGVLLLGTAFLQWQARLSAKRKRVSFKTAQDLQNRDSVLLGVVQGFSALPGFSRSGLTISALLLRNYSDMTALRVSFLMSLPIVLGGNILLNVKEGFVLEAAMVFGFLFAFLFGILTIHILFRIARKVNFAYFVLFFGVLTIASVFL